MLLSFVKEILSEQNYQVTTAPTAEEGLRAAAEVPDLILLDYVLPDMKGDEVSRRLFSDTTTEKVPVLYMSGFGTDLKSSQGENPNVIGFLNKPFTSETLLKTIQTYIPKSGDETEADPQNVEKMPAEDVRRFRTVGIRRRSSPPLPRSSSQSAKKRSTFHRT